MSQKPGIKFFGPAFFLLVGFFFFIGIASSLFAFLSIGKDSEFYFIHYKDSGKITGYTLTSYHFSKENKGERFFEEHTRLINKKGVFSEYWNRFSERDFRLKYSKAVDYRNDTQIITEYNGRRSKTEWKSAKEQDKFSYKIDKDAIIFDEINIFLIRNYKKLKDRKIKKIKVFFPQALFELKKKGLPSGLSTFSFDIKKEKKVTKQIDGKKVSGTLFVLKPASFFVRALLPDDKKKFTFLVEDSEDVNSRRILEFFDGSVTYAYTKKKPEVF